MPNLFEHCRAVQKSLFGVVCRLHQVRSKALALHIKNRIWKARVFPPSAAGQMPIAPRSA